MNYILQKGILIAYGVFMIATIGITLRSVALFLICIASTCMVQAFPYEKYNAQSGKVLFFLIFVLQLVLCCCFVEYLWFFPIVLVDYVYQKCYRWAGFFVLGPIVQIAGQLGQNHSEQLLQYGAIYVFVVLVSVFSAFLVRQNEELKRDNIEIQDYFKERQYDFQQKQKDMVAQQDYEIRIATLNERNRIAREIHDNVGHMISRSILQIGALIATNKDEKLAPFYQGLKDTLNEAMTNIRNSVHDLHDESINLKDNVDKILHDFDFCETKLEFDCSEHTDISIKYCFIAILKEALNNVMKHSRATLVKVQIIEHPAFYQCVIENNGRLEKELEEQGALHFKGTHANGIGLHNMKERAEKLGGTFQGNEVNDGFVVRVMIPKSR